MRWKRVLRLRARPPTRRLGDDALDFPRWFAQSKYRLMRRFVFELEEPPAERDIAALRERYLRTLAQGERIQRARGVVVGLLALGVISAATGAIGGVVTGEEGAALGRSLDRLAAVAGSLTLFLLVLKVALDRYLARVDVAATFIGMQIASSGRA